MKSKKLSIFAAAEDELKALVDILRNKQILRITSSVTIYRDPSSGSPSFPMDGERCGEGARTTCNSKDQNSPLRSHDELTTALSNIEENVRLYILENQLATAWAKLEESISESEATVETLEYQSELPILALAASGYEAHLCAPIIATVCVREGAESLSKNDLRHAAHCVDRGLYWSSQSMFILNPADRFKERARTGGHGKDSQREPVKDKVAALLQTLEPDGGWPYSSTAAERVSNELIEKFSGLVESCDLKTDNLPRTILRWMRSSPHRFPHRVNPKS